MGEPESEWRNFDIELFEPQREPDGSESLRVRVVASPAGEQRAAEAERVQIGTDLRRDCGRLERRELDLAGMVALGRALGDLLLPEGARRYFDRSLAALQPRERLRLRLKLDTWGFADLPWEYAWLPPGGGTAAEPEPAADAGSTPDATGFLALSPRLSIVRYELLSEPIPKLDPADGRRLRVVALFASPRDPRWAPLDLEGEQRGLRAALDSRREIALDVVEPPTLAGLERALLDGGQVFHFAGHGRFQAAIEDRIGTVAGKGFLVLCDADGKAVEVPAETVVVNLHGRGVRLAVLGACEGARRDRFNPWTGIAPALVRGGLPAAVAMQATLFDRSAVAFSTRFYEALAHGRSIDDAVSAGRIAIFNEGGAGERDWGVPVLYLRADSGVLFPIERNRRPGGNAPPPLGRRGWLNATLTTVALAAVAVGLHAYARPRLAPGWLLGGGLSLATLSGGLLAWLHWLAGDEAREWVRARLREVRTTVVGGLVALVALGGAAFAATQRPTTVRVLPGTLLTAHLRGGEAAKRFTLRVWQGEDAGEPDWTSDALSQQGMTLGAGPRVRALALARAGTVLRLDAERYLEKRGVPEAQRPTWLERWTPEHDAGFVDGPRRRRGAPICFELLENGKPVELASIGVPPGKETEDDLELLFVEPARLRPGRPIEGVDLAGGDSADRRRHERLCAAAGDR